MGSDERLYVYRMSPATFAMLEQNRVIPYKEDAINMDNYDTVWYTPDAQVPLGTIYFEEIDENGDAYGD